MDEAKIRELQSLIKEGRVECQQACNDWNRQKGEISVALEDASRIEARLLTVISAYVYAWLELGDECKRSGKARVAERMSELYWCMTKYRLQKDKLDKTRSRLESDIDELTDKMKSMESIYNELEKELEAEEDERWTWLEWMSCLRSSLRTWQFASTRKKNSKYTKTRYPWR